jgi:ABC-2 type transport system ATP-binding protein
MIEIKNLCVSYESKKVLNGLNASFKDPGIHGIVGLNGSGKTTLFNSIARVLIPDCGNILLNNKNINRSDSELLETDNYFYSNITGNEYLKIFSSTNRNFSLDAFTELFKIPLNELIETYSNGMKKKLALMSVLKQDKPVYIFDEPFNGLDLETNKVVELILKKLREKGKIILISSHILEPLIDICDTIHLLSEGKFSATYDENNYSLLKHELFDELQKSADQIIQYSL